MTMDKDITVGELLNAHSGNVKLQDVLQAMVNEVIVEQPLVGFSGIDGKSEL